jgi:hypothetical protein
MADVPGTVVPRCGAFTLPGHADRVITLTLEAPARDARLPVSEIARDLQFPASARRPASGVRSPGPVPMARASPASLACWRHPRPGMRPR